jgi:hypothetical protein
MPLRAAGVVIVMCIAGCRTPADDDTVLPPAVTAAGTVSTATTPPASRELVAAPTGYDAVDEAIWDDPLRRRSRR